MISFASVDNTFNVKISGNKCRLPVCTIYYVPLVILQRNCILTTSRCLELLSPAGNVLATNLVPCRIVPLYSESARIREG